MKATKLEIQTQLKISRKNLVANSLRALFQTFPSLREKSDESQFATCNSIKSKTAPTHSFIGTTVGHFPRTKANHVAIVFFLVDKKVLCGAKNFVDSFVAIFADIGQTFKRSNNFADHIFYR